MVVPAELCDRVIVGLYSGSVSMQADVNVLENIVWETVVTGTP